MWWYRALPSQQEASNPVYQSPSGPVGSIIYSNSPGLYSSSTGGADRSPTYGVQHGGHQHSQHAAPGDGSSQFAEESWSSSSDTSGEDEPVISPEDEEDQEYTYKSKSRYNRKQLRFRQFATPQQNKLSSSHQCFPIVGKPHHPGKKGY
ncbi:hypothetical protein CHARACLAT_020416 [Characodon lateralis]|uniref:Uncharacterized protein n=1 Tax=Characodon lateralis TaxID=208331 RepID=A0ABU7CQH4_9TELE|nr:hypothetical protein [Characodon lateralis]